MSMTAASRLQSTPAVRRAQVWSVARWCAAGLWVLVVCVAVVWGEQRVASGDLVAGLRSGTVTEVRIDGALGGAGGLVHGEQGVAHPRLVWRDGPFTRATEVVQATSQQELDQALQGNADDAQAAHVIGRVDTWLRSFAPGVRTTWGEGSGTYLRVLDRDLHGSWVWVGMAYYLLTLVVVAWGPEPRLATRAAWVWLLLTPVAVAVAPLYLLVGVRGMRPGERRLTGWWAFLLAVILLDRLASS